MKSDMLVINKIELAEYVEVDLDQMKRTPKKIEVIYLIYLALCEITGSRTCSIS